MAYPQLNNSIFQIRGRPGESPAFALVHQNPMESNMNWSNFKMGWSNCVSRLWPSAGCMLAVHEFPMDFNTGWSNYGVGLEYFFRTIGVIICRPANRGSGVHVEATTKQELRTFVFLFSDMRRVKFGVAFRILKMDPF